ncbi:MAG: hypothetical protein JWM36_1817 [Hyphomicrobiales bacterium]|nr:hypothetical protein [Hyphomicrobiales bacterium]
MGISKLPRHPFTVRKVTDNHWSLVYMAGPARTDKGDVYRFSSESEAGVAAQKLNARELRRQDGV